LATRSALRPRARTRDPEQKRALLIQTARELFARRGYAETTTADVARRAGVSEGIVFHHFGSKAGLLEAAAADYGAGLARAMFAGKSLSEKASAEEMLRAAFGYVREHGQLARLLGLSADASSLDAANRASRAQIVTALAEAFETWSAQGRIRPLDAEVTAELVFSMVESALIACFGRGDGRREREYLRETLACVEGALRKVSP
jgi:AcrR family transcriptional regulator